MNAASPMPFVTVSGIEPQFLTAGPGPQQSNHLYLPSQADELAGVEPGDLEPREQLAHRCGRRLGNQVQWLGGRIGRGDARTWRFTNVGIFGSRITAGQAVAGVFNDVPALLNREAEQCAPAVAEAIASAADSAGADRPATLVLALIAPKTQLAPPADLPRLRCRFLIFNDWQDLVVNQSLGARGNGLLGRSWWREQFGHGLDGSAYYDVSFADRPFSHGLDLCAGRELRVRSHGGLLGRGPVDVARRIAAAFAAARPAVGLIAHSQGANITLHALHRLAGSTT